MRVQRGRNDTCRGPSAIGNGPLRTKKWTYMRAEKRALAFRADIKIAARAKVGRN